MKHPSNHLNVHSRGSALLIVLAFLLLLTTLTVAFLSRATFERLLSNASFSQGKVDLAGQGAVNAVIGDLQLEIVAGSTGSASTPTLATGFLYPNSPLTAIPCPVTPANSFAYASSLNSIVGSGMENLVKISQGNYYFWSGGSGNYSPATGPARASTVSTGTASFNNRSVSAIRWNKPLLMNPVNVATTVTDFTPPSAFVQNLPDWIYVARDGSNPTTYNSSYEYLPSIAPTTTTSASAGANPVTQRYAYAIYDEGGTLDLNVAGNPFAGSTPAYSAMEPYKNALAYADLLQLPHAGPGTSTLSTYLSSAANQAAFINAIVGWRNFASAGLNNSNFLPNTYPSLSTASAPTPFDQNVIFNPTGFVAVLGYNAGGNPNLPSSSSPSSGLRAGMNFQGALNQTDNAFVSRQQLLQFFLQGLGQNSSFTGSSGSNLSPANLTSLLPYLGTFSRDISQPSYAPNPAKVTNAPIQTEANGGNDEGGLVTSTTTNGYDNTLNPAFLKVTAASAFTRNDGTTAAVGEPLAKKRFALMRLAWLTYKGPSASRNITAPSSTAGNADYDIYLLENTYCIPKSFLAQGTAANIYKYFGLSWISDTRQDGNSVNMDTGLSSKWVYNHTSANPAVGTTTSPITSLPTPNSSRNASGSAPYTTIYTLAQVAAAGREPDFVELLKAATCAGSIGKAQTGPGGFENYLDISVDSQIIQIAANIIAQYKTDGYAPRILFDDGYLAEHTTGSPPTPMAMEFRGVEDMPYFYRVRKMHFPLKDSVPPNNYTPAVPFATDDSGAGAAYPISGAGNTALTDSGLAAQFFVPEIWNPHSWNTGAATLGPRPTQFRLVAIDAPPTFAAPFPYATDPNRITAAGLVRYSQSPNLGCNSTDLGMVMVNTQSTHALSYTANSTALYFTIPCDPTSAATLSDPTKTRLDLFREPTMLLKPGVPLGSLLHFGGDPAGAASEGKNEVFNTALETASPPGESLLNGGGLSGYLVKNANGYYGIKSASSSYDLTNVGAPDDLIYLGIYIGDFPIKWKDATNVYGACTNNISGGNNTFTYRLQYQDTSSNWVTYDEKYTGLWSNSGINHNPTKQPNSLDFKLMGENSDGTNYSYMDPRTSRFGAFNNNWRYNQTVVPSSTMGNWSSTYPAGSQLAGAKQGAMRSERMDEGFGDALVYYNNPNPAGVAGWYSTITSTDNGGGTYVDLFLGYFSQNNPLIKPDPNMGGHSNGPGVEYFADADGIVRRGMSAYVLPGSNAGVTTTPAMIRPGGNTTATSATGPSGLPTANAMDYSTASATTAASQVNVQAGASIEAPSRPIILNRPFRTVGELGYVFSGTPWRNLDVSTPESGAAALLDVFCINDTNDPNGLVAGKVDLNTRQAPVLQAILAGAYKNEFAPTTTTIAGTGTSPVAAANVIAAGLVSRTTSTTAPGGPLANISELVGKYSGSNVNTISGIAPNNVDGGQTYVGFSGTQTPATAAAIPSTPANLNSILAGDTTSSGYYAFANVQRYREATIRALSNNTTTRVWNLMIDVIAQTGRFPSSASSLASFNVEGERRYWVHVAIDRYTGKVLDEQIEEVKE